MRLPVLEFRLMPGMFGLCTDFVSDALLHLFQFLCISPVTFSSFMLNVFHGHFLLPSHCAIWGRTVLLLPFGVWLVGLLG
jgi:hypothetical protein